MTKRKKLSAILLGAILALGVGAGLAPKLGTRVQQAEAATLQVAHYDFAANVTNATGTKSDQVTAAQIETLLKNASATPVPTVSAKAGDVYDGKGTGGDGIPQAVLKVGKAKGPGSFTFAINGTQKVNQVVIVGYPWKATSSLSINAGTGQTGAALTQKTYTFDITETQTFAVAVTTSAVCMSSLTLNYVSDGGGGDPEPTKTLTLIEVISGPNKKTYIAGETFDPTGVVIEATYDGESGDEYEYVTSSVVYNPMTMTLGVTEVKVSYSYGGITKDEYITGLTVNPFVGAEFTKITSIADLHIGSHYVIGSIKDTAPWVMTTTQNGNNRASETATLSGDKIKETSTSQVLELVDGNKTGSYGFKTVNGSTAGQYLCAASSSSNYLRSSATLDDNSSWVITFSSGTLSAVSQGTYTRNTLQFNATNTPPIFAAYGSASQVAVSLYVDETTVPEITFGALDHITVNTANAKTSYFVGEDFSSDGLIVTAFDAIGNSKIIDTYSANKTDGTEFVVSDIGTVNITVTGTVDGINKSADYNVTVAASRLFAKVENMAKIDTNRVYTLATELGAASIGFSGYANEVNIKHDDTNNTFNEVTDLQTIKLEAGSAAGTFALKLLNGPNADKYYGVVAGKNELSLESTISDKSSWTILIEGGSLKIQQVVLEKDGEEEVEKVRQIGHNHSNTRFAAYLTSGATPASGLYTVTTLDEIAVDGFVTNFMHPEIDVNYLGIDAIDGYNECIDEGYYAAAKAAFNALPSAQRELFVQDDAFEAPRARLTAWARANGDILNTSTKLLETPVNPTQNTFFNGLNDSNTIMLIVIISLIGVSVLGGVFYLRKREQN